MQQDWTGNKSNVENMHQKPTQRNLNLQVISLDLIMLLEVT